MGNRKIVWRELPPAFNGLGDIARISFAKMPGHCITTNQNTHFQFRQTRQQFRPPDWRAFPPRRQITAFWVIARKTQAHRQNGKEFRIVKLGIVDTQPLSKPDPRWVIERLGGPVRQIARRLPRNKDTSLAAELKNGVRFLRQRLFALKTKLAGTKLPEKYLI